MKKRWENFDTGYKEEDYFNFLKNKTVALVGPSSALFKKKRGKEIDSHDVVVKLNNALFIPSKIEKDLGSRVDVLYHVLQNFNKERLENSNLNLKWLVATNNRKGRAKNISPFIESLPWMVIDSDLIQNIQLYIKRMPNTGLITIVHLLSAPITSLTLFGLDFYRNEYHPELSYTEKNFLRAFERNDMRSQILYLYKLHNEDSRLIINKELKSIFDKI